MTHGTSASSRSVATPTHRRLLQEEDGEARRIGRREAAAEDAGELVAPGRAPGTRRRASRPTRRVRRELGHGREADRAQEQLAHRLQEEQPDHPQRADAPSAVSMAAGTISRNDSPRKTSPSTNFTGLEGWRAPEPQPGPREDRGEQDRRTGALSDRSQADGNAQPKSSVRVSWSANSEIVMPACSKIAQNIMAAMKKTSDSGDALGNRVGLGANQAMAATGTSRKNARSQWKLGRPTASSDAMTATVPAMTSRLVAPCRGRHRRVRARPRRGGRACSTIDDQSQRHADAGGARSPSASSARDRSPRRQARP